MSGDGTRKIVINGCYGGFSLSDAGLAAMTALGWARRNEYDHGREIARDDPRLVGIVERLGTGAGGEHSELVVVEIPAGIEWHISNYDGMETVHEEHRSWSTTGPDDCC